MISIRSLFGASRLFAVLAIALLAGCASPEEKAQSFYEKGADLLQQEKYLEARLQFRNALQIDEDMAPAWLGLAKVEQYRQKWRSALGALKRVTELDPKNAEAHEDIARIMLFGGNLDEALKFINTAYELAPDRVKTLTLRSVIFLKLGDTDAALAHARKVLEKEPDNAEALLVLAAERLQAGDAAAAMTFVDQGLESDPANVGMLIFKIRALEQEKNLEAAKDVLLQLVEHYPQEKAYRKALTNYHVSKGDTDSAEKEIRAIAAQSPAEDEAQIDVVRFLNTYRGFDAARDELIELIGSRENPVRFELMLAQLLFSKGEHAGAEKRLRELMEKQAGTDDGAAAKVLLARMLLEQRREDETRTLVTEILEADKDNVDALSVRAHLAVRDGDFEAAINDLRAALNQQAQSAELKVQLGRALELNGSVDLAEENYAIAMRESNFGIKFGLEYVRFLRRQGKVERAEEVMTEVMSRTRPDTSALREMASIKLQRQDWEGAEKIAEALKAVEKASGMASEIIGVALSGQNRFEESIEVLSSAQSAQPDNAGRMFALVRTYLRSGKNAEAESFLNDVLQANPNNVQAKAMLGMVKANDADRIAEAEADFKAVIEEAPDSETGYRALAGFYIRQDRPDDAETIVREGLERLPDNIPLGMLMAGFLETRGEFEQAITAYERLYKLQPLSQILANNLASLLSDHRNDEASLNRAFRLASRLKSSEVAYFKDTLAWVHFRRGDTAVALGLLEDAVKDLPEMPVVRYHLAQVLLKDGRKEGARQEFVKALELDKSGKLPFRAEAESALAKLNAQ